MNTTNSIIEQIHNEASTAEQKLLKDANRILSNSANKQVVDRVKQLQNIGFKNFKEASELSPDQIEKVKTLQELIGLYRIKSPTTKFMTDEAVVELCEKYGLVQAPVHIYIDSIPEKNQQEILDFKIDEEFLENSFMTELEVAEFDLKINGKKTTYNIGKLFAQKSKPAFGKIIQPALDIFSNWESKRVAKNWRTEHQKGILDSEGGVLTPKILSKYSNVIISALKSAIKHEYITQEDLTYYTRGTGKLHEAFPQNILMFEAVGKLLKGMREKQMELRIIAPKHMLDLEGYEINEKCKAVAKGMVVESPNVKKWFVDNDPIVQVKVRGGWLNISAWGDEASLEESFNAQSN